MKKVTYLLLLMFATVLLTTSCEEDEPLTKNDESIITLAELDGQWNFESYLYDGIELDCDNYVETTDIYNIFLNFEFDVENMLSSITLSCNNAPLLPRSFTKTNNSLEIHRHLFTIMSYNAGVLKLRLDETAYDFDYIGGILTLTK